MQECDLFEHYASAYVYVYMCVPELLCNGRKGAERMREETRESGSVNESKNEERWKKGNETKRKRKGR